jgi:hypothetical protein
MNSKIVFAILTTLGLTLSACVPAQIDTLTPTRNNTPYLDRGLTRTNISEGGIAILPVLIQSTAVGTPDIFSRINFAFPEALPRTSQQLGDLVQKAFSGAKMITSEDVMEIIGTNGETVEYIDGYFSTTGFFNQYGVVQPGLVRKIATASNSRFVWMSYLKTIFQNETLYTSALWDSKTSRTVFLSTDIAGTKTLRAEPDIAFVEASTATLQNTLGKLIGGLK